MGNQGKSRIKDRDFFVRPDAAKNGKTAAEELAVALLGKIICRKDSDGFVIKGRITVTEAYCAGEDVTDATQAEKQGKTTTQHKEGGHLYVARQGRPSGTPEDMRIDIVAGPEGSGESVLIRGIDPYDEGPINAAWALDITDQGLDGRYLPTDEDIWLEDDGAEVLDVVRGKRENLSKGATQESIDAELKFSVREIRYKV